MIGGEYKVRTITGDEFDVIYTRSSATVKGCLSHFRRMFEDSDDEWGDCWKYALEAIINWLLLYFLVHDNRLLSMLKLY